MISHASIQHGFGLVGQMLSCGPPEHEASVSAVLTERSSLSRERKALLAELAKLHAADVVAGLDAQGELELISILLTQLGLLTLVRSLQRLNATASECGC